MAAISQGEDFDPSSITLNDREVHTSVYTMPCTNKAIQICSDCRESARLKVSNNKRRGGIPKGHYLDKFQNPNHAWWFEEQHKDSEKAKGYTRGCLACKKRIKVQGVK